MFTREVRFDPTSEARLFSCLGKAKRHARNVMKLKSPPGEAGFFENVPKGLDLADCAKTKTQGLSRAPARLRPS